MSTKKVYLRKAHVRTLRNGRRLYLPPKIIEVQSKPVQGKGKGGDGNKGR